MSRGSFTEEDVRQATALVTAVRSVEWGDYIAAASLYLDAKAFSAVLRDMSDISEEWGILSNDGKA